MATGNPETLHVTEVHKPRSLRNVGSSKYAPPPSHLYDSSVVEKLRKINKSAEIDRDAAS